MTKTKHISMICLILAGALLICGGIFCLLLKTADFGFSRPVSEEEAALRIKLVRTAEEWLGYNEENETHRPIIDLYNSHTPLARGYLVQYDDSWCSTFASAAAIQSGLTDIIPTECGCQRHIDLFRDMGSWEENDNHMPLPGDYIFYVWDDFTLGDNTGWSDHVGIVVGTWGPLIKVIEGNRNDRVAYRYIFRGDFTVRGYGLPDYAALCS